MLKVLRNIDIGEKNVRKRILKFPFHTIIFMTNKKLSLSKSASSKSDIYMNDFMWWNKNPYIKGI